MSKQGVMRFGLVGCGGIGQLRAQALLRTPGCRLTAASDLDAGRLRAVTDKVGAAAVANWRELIDRSDVDAVIVSTPPSSHAEIAVEALRNGKHVLCEKPLARTPDECREIVDAAEQAGRFLATGFNYRFYPSILKARELLDSGVIGELDHVRAYSGYSAAEHGQSWLRDPDVMGGGTLRDNGIHLIDLTRYFLGEVEEVKGFATNHVWGFEGCEDNGFALLRSTTGRIATLHSSWTEWCGYRLLVEIYGTRGCIRAWCFPMRTQVSSASQRGGRSRRRTWFFPATFVMEHLRSYRWVVEQSFVREFEAFARSLCGDATALATGRDGLRAVEIAQAAAEMVGPAGSESIRPSVSNRERSPTCS